MGDLIKLLFSDRPVVGAILTCALATGAIGFWRYEGYLAKAGKDRAALRSALEAGGGLRGVYIQLLTPLLDRLDRFMGDGGGSGADPAGRDGLARYWTGASFDRCAVLALIYPMLSLVAVWIFWAEAGQIGSVLGLLDGAAWVGRLKVLGAIGCFFIACLLRKAATRRPETVVPIIVWGALFLCAVVGAVVGFLLSAEGENYVYVAMFAIGAAMLAVQAFVLAFGFAFAFAFGGSVAAAVAVAVVLACAAVADFAAPAAFAFAGAFVFAVGYLSAGPRGRHWLGLFWIGFWPLLLVASFLGLGVAASGKDSGALLSLLLMLGVIPLVNIPFDWASIGLTRALLRWGCRPGAPSPGLLGLLDLALGLVVLLLLAVALITTLQLADAIILREGGRPVARVTALLDNIARDWRDPANYWAYATLFSTLIPSVLNAVIGAASLITWWYPPTRRWVLGRMDLLDADPADERAGTRRDIQAVLALQLGLGTAAVGFALWGLTEILFEAPYVLPTVLAALRTFAVALDPTMPG